MYSFYAQTSGTGSSPNRFIDKTVYSKDNKGQCKTMSLRRAQLERQLQNAETALADYGKVLDEQKVPEDQRKKHPKWRQFNAQRVQVVNRLKSLKVLEEREASLKEGASEDKPQESDV